MTHCVYVHMERKNTTPFSNNTKTWKETLTHMHVHVHEYTQTKTQTEAQRHTHTHTSSRVTGHFENSIRKEHAISNAFVFLDGATVKLLQQNVCNPCSQVCVHTQHSDTHSVKGSKWFSYKTASV